MANDIKHGKLSQITRGSTVTDLVRVGGCASEDYFLFHRPVSRVHRTNPSGFVNKAISKNLNQNFNGLSLHVDECVGNPFTDGVLVSAHHFLRLRHPC